MQDREDFFPRDAAERAFFHYRGNLRLLLGGAPVQQINESQSYLTFAQIVPNRLAQHRLARGEVQKIVHELEGHPQISAVLSQEVLLPLILVPEHRAQTRASAEQAGRFAVDQIQMLLNRDIQPTDHPQLDQFTFHHQLRQLNQNVEDMEVALLQGHLKGLHIKP